MAKTKTKDMQSPRVGVALQGGGAHGAFTWGALDRLLEVPVDIGAVSGTSAGAMNACALVQGLMEGGPEGARQLMRRYWETVSRAAKTSPLQRSFLDRLIGRWTLAFSPSFILSQQIQLAFSPYQFNPLNYNPLRAIVEDLFDFDVINSPDAPRLFLSATNVRTGQMKVFRQPNITVDSVMASACLPHLFQAVEIDGEAYWDGGYMGNPPLFPLIDETDVLDIVLIRVNPFVRSTVPRTSSDIDNRLNEITFNASLIKELRTLAFLWETLRAAGSPSGPYGYGRLHCIADDAAMIKFDVSSKMNAERRFLRHVHKIGYEAGGRWLAEHGDKLGREGTFRPYFAFNESISPAHLPEELHAERLARIEQARRKAEAEDNAQRSPEFLAAAAAPPAKP